jgi:hypothetical protein
MWLEIPASDLQESDYAQPKQTMSCPHIRVDSVRLSSLSTDPEYLQASDYNYKMAAHLTASN